MPRPKFRKKPTQTIPTTRVSVIVVSDKEEILLVKHRKGTRQYWVLPGGRLEYGETFHECAVREMREETGLEVEVDDFVYLSEAIAPDRSRHIVNIYLTAHVVGGELKVGDEPVLAGVDFLPLDELNRLTLFPPVGKVVIESLLGQKPEGKQESLPSSTKGLIRYLGNLWV